VRTKTFVQTTLFLILAALAPALAGAEPAVYKVDPDHSSVEFRIRHFVTNVPGRFTDFQGTIKYDPQNPAASGIEVTVQAASIDTDTPDRDKHLRSEDFFDVEKYPTLSFASVQAKPVDANTLEVTGDLTIHGVTHRITIPVRLLGTMKSLGGEKAGFETSFTINRKDYGVVWNRVVETGTMLGDDVNITISVEANRQEPAK
jgi:polyisoprenoid-binding protein YceI